MIWFIVKVLDEVLNKHLIKTEVHKMLTINPVKLTTFNKKYISFGENNTNQISRVGIMSLDKNPNSKINFEKDLHDAKNADMVQTNPLKAIGYNIAKAYNILCTPKRRVEHAETTYVHIPYWA
jgi:hypothetical protein